MKKKLFFITVGLIKVQNWWYIKIKKIQYGCIEWHSFMALYKRYNAYRNKLTLGVADMIGKASGGVIRNKDYLAWPHFGGEAPVASHPTHTAGGP